MKMYMKTTTVKGKVRKNKKSVKNNLKPKKRRK